MEPDLRLLPGFIAAVGTLGIFLLAFRNLFAQLRGGLIGNATDRARRWIERRAWARGAVGVLTGLAALALWFAFVHVWFTLAAGAQVFLGSGPSWFGPQRVWYEMRTACIGLSLSFVWAGYWLGRGGAIYAVAVAGFLAAIWWDGFRVVHGYGPPHYMPERDTPAAVLCAASVPIGLWLAARRRPATRRPGLRPAYRMVTPQPLRARPGSGRTSTRALPDHSRSCRSGTSAGASHRGRHL